MDAPRAPVVVTRNGQESARSVFFRRGASLALALSLAGCAADPPAPAPAPAPVAFLFGPYKDMALGLGPDSVRGLSSLTLAFATGPCGREQMGGGDAAAFFAAHRAALEAAQVDIVVGTGGEAGAFECADAAGMERFLSHFASPRLRGIDFDIEGSRSDGQIDSLVASIAAVREHHPELRFSFTLPTLASVDGASLNGLGRRVLASAARHGLRDFLVNLMVMDYGPPSAKGCILAGGACDMGRSARQAAENLHAAFGIAWSRIELTPMIGVNDSQGNLFRLEDAETVARFVREQGLAGLHYWSLDRDRPCADEVARNDCSGVGAGAGAFLRAFRLGLGLPSPPAAS